MCLQSSWAKQQPVTYRELPEFFCLGGIQKKQKRKAFQR